MIAPNTDFAGASASLRAEFWGAAPETSPAPAPAVINVDTVSVLVHPHTFRFRGRRYRIRSVPWYEGVRLEYLKGEISRLLDGTMNRQNMLTLAHTFEEAFAILWQLTREHRWWRRNPFAKMTIGEFYTVLSFYSECRTLLPNLALDGHMGSHIVFPRRSIWRTILLSLLPRSRNGSRVLLRTSPSATITM